VKHDDAAAHNMAMIRQDLADLEARYLATSKAAAAMGRAGRGASKRRGGDTQAEVSAHMRALAALRKHPGRKPRARV
jgi:hypothetical protein